LFSGCLGLGGNKIKDQTVEEFFEEVSATIKSMDAARIADLWAHPFTLVYGEETDIWDKERIQLHVFYVLGDLASVEAWDIVDSESSKIKVVISKDGADR